jgi:hypothetical protein
VRPSYTRGSESETSYSNAEPGRCGRRLYVGGQGQTVGGFEQGREIGPGFW